MYRGLFYVSEYGLLGKCSMGSWKECIFCYSFSEVFYKCHVGSVFQGLYVLTDFVIVISTIQRRALKTPIVDFWIFFFSFHSISFWLCILKLSYYYENLTTVHVFPFSWLRTIDVIHVTPTYVIEPIIHHIFALNSYPLKRIKTKGKSLSYLSIYSPFLMFFISLNRSKHSLLSFSLWLKKLF